MRFKALIAATAAAFATLPVAASAQSSVAAPAQSTIANPSPAAVQAGHFNVEPRHTRVQFTVDHMGFTDWYGDFTGICGKLSLDPKAVAKAQVDITIPVNSVSTTNSVLDGELKSPVWFDAPQYPAIHFVSTRVQQTGARTALITGNLTFHGVTKPVVLRASFNASGINPLSKGYTVGFNATTELKRSDFGVKTDLPLIGDSVALRISAAFEKAN